GGERAFARGGAEQAQVVEIEVGHGQARQSFYLIEYFGAKYVFSLILSSLYPAWRSQPCVLPESCQPCPKRRPICSP
ncbi:MAG: hypothetical protein ACK4MR_10795, partial [Erythrobacter cryptus]